MSLEHWMMFSTFAEQDYFVYPTKNACNGVVISANMAAHAPNGLANFVVGKLTDSHKYIVDPITHAFQHDPAFIKSDNGKGKVKRSIKGLAEQYGAPISELVGNRPLKAGDIKDYKAFTKRVLQFQWSYLYACMENSEAARYLEPDQVHHPDAIVAPYFYLTDTSWEEWLPVNVNCIRESIELAETLGTNRVFAQLVFDKGILLDKSLRDSILSQYATISNQVEGCFLWVDSLDEQEASAPELRALKELCMVLNNLFKKVINLHGGYFSILLGGVIGGKCLSGVTHGPEFGEYRGVVPVGGGIPIARYYVPKLHARIRYADATLMFRNAGWLDSAEAFHLSVCNCPECRNIINGDAGNFTKFGEGEVKEILRGKGMVRIEFPFASTKLSCLRHYLHQKQREFGLINQPDQNQIAIELLSAIDEYREIAGSDAVTHLLRWKNVLQIHSE